MAGNRKAGRMWTRIFVVIVFSIAYYWTLRWMGMDAFSAKSTANLAMVFALIAYLDG